MVRVQQRLGVSERRACEVLGQARSTQRRSRKREADEAALRADVVKVAGRFGRYGYRMVTGMLRAEGWVVNHKRVERIWREEGLKVPKKQPKRGRLWLTDGSCIRLRPLYRHHVWAYDFVADRTHDGRPLKMLTVLDEYSRECLAIVVARRLRADDVLQTLSELFVEQYPNVHTFPRGEGLRPLPFNTKSDTLGAGESQGEQDVITRAARICDRFHLAVRQLRSRHENRPTLDVRDEYDVQDLLHAILRLEFEDVRPEEYTPSYAGKSSRMDFLLKAEQTVIECKKSRLDLGAKEVGSELIEDIARYNAHPDCSSLVCFVYDPEGRIANPRGLEADLSSLGGEPRVVVLIRP